MQGKVNYPPCSKWPFTVEAKHFKIRWSIQIPLSLLIQVRVSARKPKAMPWEAGLWKTRMEERGRLGLHASSWQPWLDASRSFLPQCWLTEAFLDAGDCSSPEVAARLLGLLRFWIQSWLRICAGLGLAGLSGTAEKHILKVAEKVLGCHHLICCQAKRPACDRRANSIGFGFLCCHFFSQQTDLNQAWIYVKQKPQQSNSHKCLRTLCTTLSA